MKNLKLLGVVAFVAIMFTSCKIYEIPKSAFYTDVYYTDYSRYTELGFYISELGAVPFDFDPVGTILIEQKSGYTILETVINKESKEPRGYDEIYGEKEAQKIIERKNKKEKLKLSDEYKLATAESILEAAFLNARKKNADGLVNLQIRFNSKGALVLTGMLIKRKK